MAVLVPMTVNRVQFSNFKDQNNNLTSRKAARVLFGAPNTEDVGDIDASIEEQINDDKERFRVNFGIDIDDFEECIPGTYLVNITQRKVNKLSLDKKLLDLCSRRTRKAKTRLRSSVE